MSDRLRVAQGAEKRIMRMVDVAVARAQAFLGIASVGQSTGLERTQTSQSRPEVARVAEPSPLPKPSSSFVFYPSPQGGTFVNSNMP